jgi:hypothetical protein
MSFHITGSDFRLEGKHILKGNLCDLDGIESPAEVNLDHCIGNNNGRFDWGSKGFSNSAEDVRFSIEGGSNQPVLRAKLRKEDGSLVDADVNLAERILNQNGCFVWK